MGLLLHKQNKQQETRHFRSVRTLDCLLAKLLRPVQFLCAACSPLGAVPKAYKACGCLSQSSPGSAICPRSRMALLHWISFLHAWIDQAASARARPAPRADLSSGISASASRSASRLVALFERFICDLSWVCCINKTSNKKQGTLGL